MSVQSYLSGLFNDLLSMLPQQAGTYLEDMFGSYFNPIPPTQVNATLDVGATDGHGHWINGSGIPDTGVIEQNNGHNQNAQQFDFRTGATVQPTPGPNGMEIFHGPAGPQVVDLAHGVSTANAARGAIAEGWSFDTGANGPGGMTQQAFLAAGGTEQIKIDLDPTAGVKNLVLDAVYDPVHNPGGSHIVWVADNNTFAAQGITKGMIVVNDDAGNANVTQNFTNLAFFNGLIDHNPALAGIQSGPIAPAGTYDFETIQTKLVGQTHVTLTDVHSQLVLV